MPVPLTLSLSAACAIRRFDQARPITSGHRQVCRDTTPVQEVALRTH